MTISSLPGVGDVVAGKLRVIRTIGVGGMGAVYEVEHTLTKHRRALKLLHREFSRSAMVVQRFLREASAAGRIGNAHVVETFDAGTLESGEPYIVMELLQGRTLADEILERGALPVAEACEILLQACNGMRAAHAAGIVHRDLKPENLFLVQGENPFVKILDFGISKFDPELTGAHGLTQEGSALGTPFYMPLEQVRGEKDIGVQADVYALGVILYECLTADKPYSAETLPHLVVLIHEGRYAPPSMKRPELPRECDAVVATAMAADRVKRYASIDELEQALEVLRGTGPLAADGRTLLVSPGIPGADTKHLGTPGGVQARPAASPAPPPPTAHSSFAPGAMASPEARSASEAHSEPAVSAHTEGAFGSTRSVPAQKTNVAVWVALAAGVLAAGAGAFWAFGRDDAPAASETAAADSDPLRAPSAAPAPSGQRPEVLAVTPDPAPPPSASVTATVPTPVKTAQAPTPSSSPAPRASSRAKELGLSEENPFK
jgi:serine/threonine-protein kinase